MWNKLSEEEIGKLIDKTINKLDRFNELCFEPSCYGLDEINRERYSGLDSKEKMFKLLFNFKGSFEIIYNDIKNSSEINREKFKVYLLEKLLAKKKRIPKPIFIVSAVSVNLVKAMELENFVLHFMVEDLSSMYLKTIVWGDGNEEPKKKKKRKKRKKKKKNIKEDKKEIDIKKDKVDKEEVKEKEDIKEVKEKDYIKEVKEKGDTKEVKEKDNLEEIKEKDYELKDDCFEEDITDDFISNKESGETFEDCSLENNKHKEKKLSAEDFYRFSKNDIDFISADYTEEESSSVYRESIKTKERQKKPSKKKKEKKTKKNKTKEEKIVRKNKKEYTVVKKNQKTITKMKGIINTAKKWEDESNFKIFNKEEKTEINKNQKNTKFTKQKTNKRNTKNKHNLQKNNEESEYIRKPNFVIESPWKKPIVNNNPSFNNTNKKLKKGFINRRNSKLEYEQKTVRLINSMIDSELTRITTALTLHSNNLKEARLITKQRINSIVKQTFKTKEIQIKEYGSFSTKLLTPFSDLDLLIHSNSSPDKRGTLQILQTLTDVFSTCFFIKKINPILTATVPVIKLEVDPSVEYKQTNIFDKSVIIKVDIIVDSVDEINPTSTAIRTTNYILYCIEQYPSFFRNILLLKYALNCNGLSNAYNGGLTAYGLSVLYVAYLESHLLSSDTDLFKTLIGFLDFLCFKFNPETTAVNFTMGSELIKTPFVVKNIYENSLLVINDPSSIVFKNITPGCFNFNIVVEFFKRVLKGLCSIKEEQFNEDLLYSVMGLRKINQEG